MNQQAQGPGAGSSYGGYRYQFLATAWVQDLAITAVHDDDRLAGPSILALACAGSPAAQYLEGVAKADITVLKRSVIAEAALPGDAADLRALFEAKSKGYPCRALLDLPESEIPTVESWPHWLAAHPSTAEWLKSIKPSEGLNPVIRYSLSLRFGEDVPPKLTSDDKFDAVQPEPIRTTSLHSLFGGE